MSDHNHAVACDPGVSIERPQPIRSLAYAKVEDGLMLPPAQHDVSRQRLDQAGLADAGWSADQDNPPGAFTRIGQPGAEKGQLLPAPNESVNRCHVRSIAGIARC